MSTERNYNDTGVSSGGGGTWIKLNFAKTAGAKMSIGGVEYQGGFGGFLDRADIEADGGNEAQNIKPSVRLVLTLSALDHEGTAQVRQYKVGVSSSTMVPFSSLVNALAAGVKKQDPKNVKVYLRAWQKSPDHPVNLFVGNTSSERMEPLLAWDENSGTYIGAPVIPKDAERSDRLRFNDFWVKIALDIVKATGGTAAAAAQFAPGLLGDWYAAATGGLSTSQTSNQTSTPPATTAESIPEICGQLGLSATHDGKPSFLWTLESHLAKKGYIVSIEDFSAAWKSGLDSKKVNRGSDADTVRVGRLLLNKCGLGGLWTIDDYCKVQTLRSIMEAQGGDDLPF